MTVTDPVLPTGIAGLDMILGGGVTRPALGVIIGAPGAGKTVLASQILFTAARAGLKGIVFTAFSEGAAQYIQHLRSFSFFDESALGDTIHLFPLASQITGEDASPATAIAQTIRSLDAKVVVLDGFQGTDTLLPSDQQARALLATLSTQIRYLNATIFVILSGGVHDAQFNQVMTTADIGIGLHYQTVGRQHERLLEVVKIRGRAQWAGLHSYGIDETGIQVYPRIECYPLPEPHPPLTGRAPFQLPELDDLLHGGLNIGTTTVLAGAPSVGKTILGLQWGLADAHPDAVTLFFTFTEHQDQLEQKATAFGLDLAGAISQNSVRVVRFTAMDLNPDQLAHRLVMELAAGPVRRLVIDDITLVLHRLGERSREYLSALNEIVYGARIPSLYLLEIAPFEGLRLNLTQTPLTPLGDTVIMVQQYEMRGQLRRVLAVVRMRLSPYNRTLCELLLDDAIIRIVPLAVTDAAFVTSGARLSEGIALDPPTPADRDDELQNEV